MDFASVQRLQKQVKATLNENFFFNPLSNPKANVVKGGQLSIRSCFGQPRTQVDGLLQLQDSGKPAIFGERSCVNRSRGGQFNRELANRNFVSRLEQSFFSGD